MISKYLRILCAVFFKRTINLNHPLTMKTIYILGGGREGNRGGARGVRGLQPPVGEIIGRNLEKNMHPNSLFL